MSTGLKRKQRDRNEYQPFLPDGWDCMACGWWINGGLNCGCRGEADLCGEAGERGGKPDRSTEDRGLRTAARREKWSGLNYSIRIHEN